MLLARMKVLLQIILLIFNHCPCFCFVDHCCLLRNDIDNPGKIVSEYYTLQINNRNTNYLHS